MKNQFMEAGKAVGTHGVRGEIKIEPWCDSAQFLSKFKTLYLDANGTTALQIQSIRPHKTNALCKFVGIDSIEDAEKMRGKVFYFAKEDVKLPENQWFVDDLMGARVIDADTKKEYGVISDVYLNPKANDAWTVQDSTGKETMIPAIPTVIAHMHLKEKTIEIHAMQGLFEGQESVIEDEN